MKKRMISLLLIVALVFSLNTFAWAKTNEAEIITSIIDKESYKVIPYSVTNTDGTQMEGSVSVFIFDTETEAEAPFEAYVDFAKSYSKFKQQTRTDRPVKHVQLQEYLDTNTSTYVWCFLDAVKGKIYPISKDSATASMIVNNRTYPAMAVSVTIYSSGGAQLNYDNDSAANTSAVGAGCDAPTTAPSSDPNWARASYYISIDSTQYFSVYFDADFG